MTRHKTIKTTLGDLVAAVTEEVTADFGDSSFAYSVVSYVVSDILTRYRGNERENPRALLTSVKRQAGKMIAARVYTDTRGRCQSGEILHLRTS